MVGVEHDLVLGHFGDGEDQVRVVADRGALDNAKGVWKAVEQESERLEGRGRVLVRPSGTEPLVRVMVEAPDEAECDEVVERLVETVQKELA